MVLSKLEQYGKNFQLKVIASLLIDKKFLKNTIDSLISDYFENESYKWVIDEIIKYYEEFHTTVTPEVLKVAIKKINNDVLQLSVTDSLKEAYHLSDTSEDLDWVKKEFRNFCINQQMKSAILNSVDLLNIGDYDGIKSLISKAMRADTDKNIGLNYKIDVESRYRKDDRNAIPFPWKTFNDITQGGMGGGDLILIFGNPKGGKSWSVIDIGAFAAQLGYNVLHYSLELGEGYTGKRYDSALTGIDVSEIHNHRSHVETIMKNLKGRIIIKEYPPKRASFSTIEAHMHQLENEENFKPDLIIIDYLDYIKTKSKKDRKEEIDDVYVYAKGLAKELNIPIISPSQANRTGAGEGILESQHAAGSYDKIMIADILISLARTRKDKKLKTGKWHIMGNRYGPDGLTFSSTIDTSNGKIEISEIPLDDDEIDKDTVMVGAFDEDDKDYLRTKFFNKE